ncbi:MAG: 1,6-anhydro-N-acetylmuramyl-L-alanine amidase AmpD [Chromatiales bacterium]
MKLDPDTGLLHGASYLPSPNCDDRPPGSAIELLVIHGISLPPGEFGSDSIDRLFTNRLCEDAHPYFREVAQLRISAHLLVRRDGSVTQYVPLNRRAWHAGASCFRGRERCNDFSIGIELEGANDIPYTARQYRRLASIARLLVTHWPAITIDRIVGHSDIAPGRKTDPGPAFDWQRFRRSLLPVGSRAEMRRPTP